MKIALGIPSMDMCHTDFAMSLAMLVSNSSHELGIINEKTSVIQKGRHTIVERALELGADKILFLDTDMVFPRDTIDRLIARDKLIVGCNASTRTAPFKSTAKDLDGKYVDIKSDMITKVGYLGTGCLLVDMEVFKKIGKPYFDIKWNDVDFLNEDYNFCVRAREEGYDIWCDTKMSKEIVHLGQARYTL